MKIIVTFKDADDKSIVKAVFRKLATAKAHVVRCAQTDWGFACGFAHRPKTFEQALKFLTDSGVTVTLGAHEDGN